MGVGTNCEPLIALVDDQRDVRTTLSRGLAAHGFRCHPLASGQDLIETLEYLSPDCILLDMRMPGLDGLETLKAIDDKRRGTPVLFFTSHGDVPLAVQAMQLGATDFIEKPSTLAEIAAKIRSALAKSEKGMDDLSKRKESQRMLPRLTVREREILSLVAQGLINKDIAEQLGLSIRTVESHRAHAVRKIGDGRLATIIKLFEADQTI